MKLLIRLFFFAFILFICVYLRLRRSEYKLIWHSLHTNFLFPLLLFSFSLLPLSLRSPLLSLLSSLFLSSLPYSSPISLLLAVKYLVEFLIVKLVELLDQTDSDLQICPTLQTSEVISRFLSYLMQMVFSL